MLTLIRLFFSSLLNSMRCLSTFDQAIAIELNSCWFPRSNCNPYVEKTRPDGVFDRDSIENPFGVAVKQLKTRRFLAVHGSVFYRADGLSFATIPSGFEINNFRRQECHLL